MSDGQTCPKLLYATINLVYKYSSIMFTVKVAPKESQKQQRTCVHIYTNVYTTNCGATQW